MSIACRPGRWQGIFGAALHLLAAFPFAPGANYFARRHPTAAVRCHQSELKTLDPGGPLTIHRRPPLIVRPSYFLKE